MSSDAKVLSIYQLLSAIDAKEDKEWLYNVDANNNVTYDTVVKLAIADRIMDAKEALDAAFSQSTKSHPSKRKDVDDHVLQTCIVERLESVNSRTIHDFVVTSRPTRLW